jgi:hypothetical protein
LHGESFHNGTCDTIRARAWRSGLVASATTKDFRLTIDDCRLERNFKLKTHAISGEMGYGDFRLAIDD